MDEDNLIKNIRKGEEFANRAFILLANRYRGAMHRQLHEDFSTFSNEEHDEIIQETFLKVFVELKDGKFEGRSSLKTWILRILKHEAIDQIRKHKRSPQGLKSYSEDSYNTQQGNHTPLESDISACTKIALNEYRKDYPEEYASLMLAAEKGLNAKQLATVLQISHGATRERLSSYRKKLKIYLEKHCGDE